MKNVNISLPDDTHARLREYAWRTRQTLADALRQALDHCLPPLPGHDPKEGEPANDAQADEVKP